MYWSLVATAVVSSAALYWKWRNRVPTPTQLKQVAEVTSQVLSKAKIAHCATQATLLSQVRPDRPALDARHVNWAINQQDWPKVQRLAGTQGWDTYGWQSTFSVQGISVRFHQFKLTDDPSKVVWPCANAPPEGWMIPADVIFPLQPGPIALPAQPAVLVELMFGAQWRIPMRPQQDYQVTWEKGRRVITTHLKEPYWDAFYARASAHDRPSSMATSLVLKPRQTLLELGAGCGRDVRYYARQGLKVTALDGSEEAVKRLPMSIRRKCIKFEQLETDTFDRYQFDWITARWIWHAVEAPVTDHLLTILPSYMHPQSKLVIEVRTTQDRLCGQGQSVGDNAYIFGHYRRFAVPSQLIDQAQAAGFQVIKHQEGYFSPHKGDNPHLLRLTLQLQANTTKPST